MTFESAPLLDVFVRLFELSRPCDCQAVHRAAAVQKQSLGQNHAKTALVQSFAASHGFPRPPWCLMSQEAEQNLEGVNQVKISEIEDLPDKSQASAKGAMDTKAAADVARTVSAPSTNFVRLQSFLNNKYDAPGWRGRLERLLRSTKYDVCTGIIIIVDVGLNWYDIDLRASGVETPPWQEWAASFCLVIYSAEMTAFTVLRGRRVLHDMGFLLDLLIVASGVAQIILEAAGISVDQFTLLRVLQLDCIEIRAP